MNAGFLNTLTVRSAGPEDEPGMADVDRLAVATLRRVYRPTSAGARQQTETRTTEQPVVAMVEGRIVGVVRYYFSADRLFLFRLGVHTEYRRRGVCGALIRELERIGRCRGCTDIALHAVRETGNVEIFRRLGFVVESEQPTDLFESTKFARLHEVVMRKDFTTVT
jgi:ribosomal protein S18 acetylase RimI-like enzyme